MRTSAEIFLATILKKSILSFSLSVDGEDPSEMLVGYGDHDLAKIYDRKQYAEVDAYYKHPNYTFWSNNHDIALIKLKKSLNFAGKAIKPACLPLEHRDHYKGVLRVSSKDVKAGGKV